MSPTPSPRAIALNSLFNRDVDIDAIRGCTGGPVISSECRYGWAMKDEQMTAIEYIDRAAKGHPSQQAL